MSPATSDGEGCEDRGWLGWEGAEKERSGQGGRGRGVTQPLKGVKNRVLHTAP